METPLTPIQNVPQETPAHVSRPELRLSSWILLLVSALLFGFAGGKLATVSEKIHLANLGRQTVEPTSEDIQEAKENAVAEDQAVIDVVEKSTRGVVSIVITKDVPQLKRGGFGGFPFFFSPFGIDDLEQSPQGSTDDSTKRQVGSGSGFIVSAEGLVVTNKHVVSDTTAEYTIITNDGKEYGATVLARDPNNDIALLKIEGTDFPALPLGDSDTLKVGQTAIAIGNPLGEFANSVSRGIVSGLQRDVTAGSQFLGDVEKLTNIIQTDAAINPGNSGGPLLNLFGEVVGVNVAVAQGAENIGFAIPVNSIKRAVNEVKATGKISTPYLGVRYIPLNDSIQKNNNLPYNYGALVLRGETMTDFAVIPGSPADKAGIMENDIILEFQGQKVDAEHPLGKLIGERSVGEEVTLKLWHKGEVKEINVRLEERE